MVYFLEKYACRNACQILCVSEEDRNIFCSIYNIAKDKICLLPNTVDIEYYSKTKTIYNKLIEQRKIGIKDDSFVVLFSGRMDYRPNVDGLKFILTQLVPKIEEEHLKVQILIVGAQIPRWCWKFKNKVMLFNNVPDMRRYFAIADAVVVPLNHGGGTRLKILESFAAGLPVISTKIGCEGINYKDGENLLTAQRSADDIIRKITLLREFPQLREQIIKNAFQLVVNKYSTKTATDILEKVLSKIIT
jgi:glycosyltransferase involved in cell wall biosynthesis